jgi:hypothetical protein
MGKSVNKEPAKCHCCGKDFESSGKYRYQVLKRHLKEVHGLSKEQIGNHQTAQTINNITYSNCVINNNINVFDGAVRHLLEIAKDDKEFIKKLTDYLVNFQSIPATLCLFDKLHCNAEYPVSCIAVVPNVSKNTMLVRDPDGEFEPMSKDEGAEKALSIFYDKSVELIKDSFHSEKIEKSLMRAYNSDELPKRLVRSLENVDKKTRKSVQV